MEVAREDGICNEACRGTEAGGRDRGLLGTQHPRVQVRSEGEGKAPIGG